MRSLFRPGPLALVAVGLAAAGCGSSNKEEIEGKWKVLSASRDPGVLEQKAAKQLFFTYKFTADGTLTIGTESSARDPGRPPPDDGDPRAVDLKYKLKSGHGVEVFDVPAALKTAYGGLFALPDHAVLKVEISGTEMKITEPDGNTVTLLKFQ